MVCAAYHGTQDVQKARNKIMKKRILAAVLTAVMAMGALTGCGSTAGKDNYTIGIMQYAVHGSLDNCREGFIQGLAEEGIVEGENLTIEYVNAQADNGTSAMTASNFVSKKVDMICAIATPCAMAAYNATMNTDIPVIYTAVSDPVEAGLANEDGTPVGNITGTSDALAVDAQLKMIREVLPEAKTIGIIYTTVVSALQTVLDEANKAGIPVFGSEVEQVKAGCVASMGLEYIELGKQTGKMAARVLKGEAEASELNFEVISEPRLYVNFAAAEKINLELPENYKTDAYQSFDEIVVQ